MTELSNPGSCLRLAVLGCVDRAPRERRNCAGLLPFRFAFLRCICRSLERPSASAAPFYGHLLVLSRRGGMPS
jgi:hypothetical protein